MNEAKLQVSRWNKFFFSISLTLIILFMGGMYLVNYAVAKTMGWSILISATLFVVFSFLLKKLGVKSTFLVTSGIISILCITVTFSIFANIFTNNAVIEVPYIPDCETQGETKDIRSLSSHHTEIEFFDPEAGLFKAKGFITYDVTQYVCHGGSLSGDKVIAEGIQKNLPEIEVTSTPLGYFLNEITIPIDKWDAIKGMSFSSNSTSSVNIENLPYQSFYDAAYIDHINSNEYMGKERISWDEDYTSSMIRFVYIRPPFHNLRPIIAPLIEFSKYDNILLAVIGFLIPFILFSIISPVIVGYFQNAVRNLLKKPVPITISKPKNTRKSNRN